MSCKSLCMPEFLLNNKPKPEPLRVNELRSVLGSPQMALTSPPSWSFWMRDTAARRSCGQRWSGYAMWQQPEALIGSMSIALIGSRATTQAQVLSVVCGRGSSRAVESNGVSLLKPPEEELQRRKAGAVETSHTNSA